MRVRVIVAMIGWRLELALMVLKVNFLPSCPDGTERGCIDPVDVPDIRRAWPDFNTQRAFRVSP